MPGEVSHKESVRNRMNRDYRKDRPRKTREEGVRKEAIKNEIFNYAGN